MTTGDRIKHRRKELSLSAEYIAEKLGVSPATIYRYENGEIDKVPAPRLAFIAELLKTTPEYLMGWEDSPIAHNSDSLPPAHPLVHETSDAALKFALFGTADVDDDVFREVKKFAKFAMENHKPK